jgi:exopolysaccharide production protein ExoQ
MPPFLALLLWVILLLGLLCYDPARDVRSSPALWVPLLWLFILGSRLPAQWLSGQAEMFSGGALEEGNPLDRSIFVILILLAVWILVSRSFRWSMFVSRNSALTAFLAFALLSVFWSDFPMVALKRWLRDLGNYLVILVILSDRCPMKAVTTVLRRLCFVLISLSVVLIKYYPEIGRGYDTWTGAAVYCGVTTSKYLLAVICLISGIYFFWDTVTRWPNRKERRTRWVIYVNVLFIAMTLWVLNLANGATSKVCLVVGCLVITAANSRVIKRSPGLLKWLIPLAVCLSFVLVFGIDMKADIATAVGRDPTFTDRTLLWSYLLSMKIDPFVGTGYESFWLGPRLEQLWVAFAFKPNQAHNGFLEIYLELGLIGVVLLVAFLAASYWTICKKPFAAPTSFASLSLALWAVVAICNITTAAFFKSDLLWLTFLLGTLDVPGREQRDLGDQVRRHGIRQLTRGAGASEVYLEEVVNHER